MRKFPSCVVKNVGLPAQPAKTSDISSILEAESARVINKLWGSKDYSDNYPPGVCGTWQEWEWYLAFIMSPWNNLPNGYWNVDEAYTSAVCVPNYNTVIGTNFHDFGSTLLTGQRNSFRPGVPSFKSGNISFLSNKNKYLWDGTIKHSIDNETIAQDHLAPTMTRLAGAGSTYAKSMWHPSHRSFNWSEAKPKTPDWMYFGLQDIPAITAATDNVTYQEGQVFIELKCELEGYSNMNTMTNRQPTKHYTDVIYTMNDSDIDLGDRGQGFMYGKPYFEITT
jgi:hypothetical protein